LANGPFVTGMPVRHGVPSSDDRDRDRVTFPWQTLPEPVGAASGTVISDVGDS
jgi:hypothetical protein